MILEVKQINTYYETSHILFDVSLSIESGEVVCLLGRNGAGKTTTVRMLSALIGPTSGTAQVAGFQVGRQDQDIRRNVGILTEAPGLYDGGGIGGIEGESW